MSSYVSAALRRLVTQRADNVCEYCLIHQEDTFLGCEIEHVIAEKHGGPTAAENLALACFFCNSFKGTDIASLTGAGLLCRLFNPRTDLWRDHFALDRDKIRPLTDVGEVTVRLLRINVPDRVEEREALRMLGRYPTVEAKRRIT